MKKILVVDDTPSMADILRKCIVEPVKYDLGETKVIVHCEGHDVEKIIEKEYGFKEYSITASEEIGNYTSSEFTVDGELSEYDMKQVELREEMYMTRNYLNDLARRGKIQKGDYVVDTSW
jgi:hypothetical protein